MTHPLPQRILQDMKSYPPFFQKVWLACASIPKGQTRSYGWIAKKIGSPGASRAVGTALRMNPFAPIVPCHRVIKANGDLGAYSAPGGTPRKRKMLIKEGAFLKGSLEKGPKRIHI